MNVTDIPNKFNDNIAYQIKLIALIYFKFKLKYHL